MAENNQQPAEELTQEQLSEQNRIRREKLKALQEAGKDPFRITHFERTHQSRQIVEQFDSLEGQEVVIAGRMMCCTASGRRWTGRAC